MKEYNNPKFDILYIECDDILLVSKVEEDMMFDETNIDEIFG